MNVLVGANGAGKSNLISFFDMLREMMKGGWCLQSFVLSAGGSRSLLFYGPEVTPRLEARLDFEGVGDIVGIFTYEFELSHAPGDSPAWGDKLVFTEESLSVRGSPMEEPTKYSLGRGHGESHVVELDLEGDPMAMAVRQILSGCRVYHFHDTKTLIGRQMHHEWSKGELQYDGRNLASFLHHLKSQASTVAYQRIVRTIRLVAPFIEDFVLEPSGDRGTDIELHWRDQESGQILGPHQLSDGTLRVCASSLSSCNPRRNFPI